MKVMTSSPVTFLTTNGLDSADLNTVYSYVRTAINDVAARRFTRSMLTYNFVTDVGTAYTNTANEMLIYRFTCPNTCIIERAYLSANMTSSAEVKVDITTAAGGAVSGAVSPLLTTGGAVASADTTVEDFSGNRIVLTAGVEYRFTVSSSAAFTLNRFDVTLHLATDRWVPAGSDQAPTFFSPYLFDETSYPEASQITSNNTNASGAAGYFATYSQAASPVLFTMHGLTNATLQVYRAHGLPRFDSARAAAKIVGIYLYAFMAGTGGTTVTATLADAAGSTIHTTTANVSGVTVASAGGAVSLASDLSVATPGVSVDVNTSGAFGSDWILTFTNASATVTASKVYCLLWLSR